MRSFLAQIRDIQSRVIAFEAVHDFKPGDYPNASDLWGIDSCGGTTYGANGDGDGLISYSLSSAVPQLRDSGVESYLAWCHMTMANLGSELTVISDLLTTPIAGVHLPKTRLGGAFHITSGSANTFGLPETTNAIVAGEPLTDMSTPDSLLTPQQALSIDSKIDDGSPDTGSVRAASGGDVSVGNECTVSSGSGDDYKLDHSKRACTMSFALQ